MKTKKDSEFGRQAWEWMQQRCPKWGVLLVPRAKFPYGTQSDAEPLTVGEMERACGRGALTAAKRYCQREYSQQAFGAHYPYAGRIIETAVGQRLLTVPDGEELPTDAVYMHYPVVG